MHDLFFKTSGFVLKQFWLGLTYLVTMCTHQATEENFEKNRISHLGFICQMLQLPMATSPSSHVSVKLYTLKGINKATIHHFLLN